MRAINRNKIIAVMSAIVVFMVSMCTYSAEANATNTSRVYKVYNAQSGAYLQQRDYTLGAYDDYDNSGNARNIIGDYDERVIDWTKSGVVKLMTATSYGGTGFVVDEHTIATAAHCVYNNSTQKGKEISEILLFDNTGIISLSATPVETHIPYDYVKNVHAWNAEYFDYALITVEEDLSDYMCFNLGVTLDSFASNNRAVTVTGFPQDLNNDNDDHNMYSGNGVVTQINSHRLYYTCDANSGNSGGPVYFTETRLGNIYYTVLAIHTTGGNNNQGTRITTDLLHFYMNNPNISYE